jgi:hypothetical protein
MAVGGDSMGRFLTHQLESSAAEPHIHVIVRGKAGEEVEFGNLLVLGEQRDGLIMDWELFNDSL